MTERRPVLYSGNRIKETIRGASDVERSFLARYRLWLPQYASEPKPLDADGHALPWKSPWLWQYTGDGSGPLPHTLPGAHGNLDINHFGGTDEELAAQWAAG